MPRRESKDPLSFFADDKELSESLESRRLNSPRGDSRESINTDRPIEEDMGEANFGGQ